MKREMHPLNRCAEWKQKVVVASKESNDKKENKKKEKEKARY